jgi:demethylmenaquinone methyltransferase/2-methoxy-6-polyprenyl-1,4-benzoquinol methylase
MAALDEDPRERTRRIQQMFGRIVPRYDGLNRLMSFGMDSRWRRAAADAAVPAGLRILDIGTGTGDLARELAGRDAASIVGSDVSPVMLRQAAKRHAGQFVWCAADAQRLPFRGAAFDVVTNAFVLRNLPELSLALGEMRRVLRPGGRLICLDMTQPPRTAFAAAYRLYFNHVLPPVAGLLSGQREAYRYLPASLERFPNADGLARMMAAAGFEDVSFRRMGGGAIALHTATARG